MIRFFSVLILLLSLQIGFSQENSLLWEINKKGYHTSYLFGTIHLVDERVFTFQNQLIALISDCDAYAGEIIVDPSDFLAIMPYLIEEDSSKQCINVLSSEEFVFVSKAMQEKLGEGIEILLPTMAPYVVAILLSSPNDYESKPDQLFLDIHLQEKAASLDKKLISLESVESQFEYLSRINIETQKTHLLQTAEEGVDDEEYEEVLAVYLKQDLEGIRTLIEQAKEDDPLISDAFVDDRNIIQKDGIVKAIKNQTTFIAVGAAHLPGDKGILSLLKNEGFTVNPVALKTIE